MENRTPPPTDNVLSSILPRTGAQEAHLVSDQDDYEVYVAHYVLRGHDVNGVLEQIPAFLMRYTFTEEQRKAIAAGEDLFIAVLDPNGRGLPRMQVQLGPGSFQLESRIVSPHDNGPSRPGGIILPGR